MHALITQLHHHISKNCMNHNRPYVHFLRARSTVAHIVIETQYPGRGPMSFRLLDLFADLRNHIYNFAAIGDGEPKKLLNLRKRPNHALRSENAKALRYCMGLAQASVCGHDFADFHDTFYQDYRFCNGSPRDVTVEVSGVELAAVIFYIIPILRIQALQPEVKCFSLSIEIASISILREFFLFKDFGRGCTTLQDFCELND
ncbi:hypothetical protein EJ02DRAFT_423432 [Clathrospora elynae]|uniref:Uncharacterized protein n=1 Tax=Clathrospora elynae TaxID=706981 RepID=A0A6A5SKB4_9PLEO|nr:hypothetical protein EJ02DRAFT_423432 [Clathrospora elynae]